MTGWRPPAGGLGQAGRALWARARRAAALAWGALRALAGRLIGRLTGRLTCRLTGRLTGSLAGRLTGWLVRLTEAVRRYWGARGPAGLLRDRRRARAAAAILLALALALPAGYWLTLGPLPRPRQGSGEQVFLVPAGQATGQIANRLAAAGLIRNATAFRLWAGWTGQAGRLRAGEYLLDPAMGSPAIIAKLAAGRVLLHPVTIPEGHSLAQIRQLLVDRGFASPEAFDRAAAEAARTLVPAHMAPERPQLILHPMEGYLFPETYMLYRGISEAEIIRTMFAPMRELWTPARLARARELGLSVAEVLTLASIIEEEAVVAEERSLISGVFHNRLRLRMALGACPTVRYVMPDPRAPITSREKAIASPYNTYVTPGLPPGPISSPGLASIDAALHPARTDYLYFVSKNDGSHAFSRTYAEHLANIRRFPP